MKDRLQRTESGYTYDGRDGRWEIEQPISVEESYSIVSPTHRIYNPEELRFNICSFCEPGEDYDEEGDEEPAEYCIHDQDLLKEEKRANALRIIIEKIDPMI